MDRQELKKEAHEVHTASCDLPTASCDLLTASCDLHTASCDLLTASCDLYTASCDLHTASCDLLTASCDDNNSLIPILTCTSYHHYYVSQTKSKSIYINESHLSRQADEEVLEALRRFTSARQKKRSVGRKEKEAAWKALQRRDSLYQRLDQM